MNSMIFSGYTSGAFRCGRRREMSGKIPKLETGNVTDTVGIILTGIRNYGNKPDMIRQTAAEALECAPEDVMIPFDRLSTAKRKFVSEVIYGRLNRTLPYSVNELVRTFYEFVETPTERTKELQIRSDIRDIMRYLNCENRTSLSVGHPVVNICGQDFVAETDLVFLSNETIQTGKRKEKGKWVYDTEEVRVLEAVRIFPGKPQVSAGSGQVDVAATKRLELYIFLKSMEKLARSFKDENMLLKASYYYLQKNREKDENYSDDFFGKGGNVVSIQAHVKDMKSMDELFEPQILSFIRGEEVSSDKCETCRYRAICDFRMADIPIPEEEKPMPESLPVLSKAQKEAAEALTGNIRVIATAGSGKTTAMAYRIMNLLKAGVDPRKIGCFTFTNAGADEMADRINGFCKIAGIDADVSKITISTIHSFGDSLLKKYHGLLGYQGQPELINDIQKTRIIESILATNPPVKGQDEAYKRFYMDLFRAKGILALMIDCFEMIENGVSIKDFMKAFSLSEEAAKAVGKMYIQYKKRKKEACLIDHYDQEHGVLELLKVKPDLFDEVGIEHISVDEYQDTSMVQFQIIDAMRKASCVKSLFIVGDDDQSIYGFRDADVTLIKNFREMIHEDVRDIRLNENRRSSKSIVDFADAVISNNSGRIPKYPVSVKGTGEPVSVNPFANREEEKEFIVNEVERLIKAGRNERDIAILAPTNSELLEYADMLTEKGIKYISINPEPVLGNSNVMATISLVRFLNGKSEFDGVCYLNALNGGEVMNDLLLSEKLKKLSEKVSEVKDVEQFLGMVSELDPSGTDEIFQKFLDNTLTAKRAAVENGNLRELLEYITDFARFGKKETERKEKLYNGVVLSTMHSSKGKEWPVVFCSVSKMHAKDLKKEDIPEKNRLLFVACTRAMEKLYVTGVEEISSKSGSVKNMFLEECLCIAENRLAS